MQISIKHKFAFLCIPKNASTSVEAAIQDYCDISFIGNPVCKHISAQKFNRYLNPYLQSTFPNKKIEVFCVLRDPIERLHSWYRYRSRKELKDPSHHNHKHYTGNLSFEKFVMDVMSNNPPAHAKISSQLAFLSLTDGSLGVDLLFSVKHLVKLEEYLSAKIGQKLDIPQRNISRNKEQYMLSPSLLSELKLFYSEDYELLAKVYP